MSEHSVSWEAARDMGENIACERCGTLQEDWGTTECAESHGAGGELQTGSATTTLGPS